MADLAQGAFEVLEAGEGGVDGGVEFAQVGFLELARFGVVPGFAGLLPAFAEVPGEPGESVGVAAGGHGECGLRVAEGGLGSAEGGGWVGGGGWGEGGGGSGARSA